MILSEKYSVLGSNKIIHPHTSQIQNLSTQTKKIKLGVRSGIQYTDVVVQDIDNLHQILSPSSRRALLTLCSSSRSSMACRTVLNFRIESTSKFLLEHALCSIPVFCTSLNLRVVFNLLNLYSCYIFLTIYAVQLITVIIKNVLTYFYLVLYSIHHLFERLIIIP